jgi:hypothetical protein
MLVAMAGVSVHAVVTGGKVGFIAGEAHIDNAYSRDPADVQQIARLLADRDTLASARHEAELRPRNWQARRTPPSNKC